MVRAASPTCFLNQQAASGGVNLYIGVSEAIAVVLSPFQANGLGMQDTVALGSAIRYYR